MIYLFNMVIFHSYVKLPEGNSHDNFQDVRLVLPRIPCCNSAIPRQVGGILVGLGAQIQMAKLVSTDSESRVLKSEPGASGFFMTQWICGKRIYASEIQPGRESMQRKMPRTIKRKDARSDVWLWFEITGWWTRVKRNSELPKAVTLAIMRFWPSPLQFPDQEYVWMSTLTDEH